MSGYPPGGRSAGGGGFWDDSTVPLLIGLLIGISMVAVAIVAGLPGDPDPRARPAAAATTTATTPQETPTVPEEFERFELTVTNAGDGRGTISVDGETRDCSDLCTFELEAGTQVTLVARVRSGSTFAGWTDPCDVSRTCRFSIDGETSVTALFDLIGPSTTECEDGVDNDVDDFTDADDPDCATSDSESPAFVAPPPAQPLPPPVVAPPPPPPPLPPPPPPVDLP